MAVIRNVISHLNLSARHCFRKENNRYVGYYIRGEFPHNDKFEYDVTRDAEDWKNVAKLLTQRTVPEPKVLDFYPSGWRPMSETSLKHPYFVERSKNHMLSVYLKIYDRGQLKITAVKKIRGDIWLLHEELKNHLQNEIGKKIASYVVESSAMVKFKGDHVYYVEQWMLAKGF